MTNETEKTVSERVRSTIAETVGLSAGQVANDSLSFEEVGADSLDIVTMWMILEEEFGIEIDETEADSVSTVGSVVEMVERLYPAARCDVISGGSQMNKDANTAAGLSAEIQKITDHLDPHIAFSALAAVIAETACDCAESQVEALSKTDEACTFARNLVLAHYEDEDLAA